jgi:hypothetical protein
MIESSPGTARLALIAHKPNEMQSEQSAMQHWWRVSSLAGQTSHALPVKHSRVAWSPSPQELANPDRQG